MAPPIARNRSLRIQRLTLSLLTLLLGFSLADRRAVSADIWWPENDFPAADRATAPRWLTNEKICFSRWDGGRIEACKGFLSGWTFFNNPPWPDVIHATSQWYDPQTVHLAERMGYNFLWVTFSAGFSIELERGQWDELRVYVAACHKKNIKVAAYMSSTNMFVDDMLTHVPESRDWLLIGDHGKPVPYGAANFKRMGRTTRMLADISHPGWRAYLKRRIDAAIDIGVDAIEYDNVSYVIGGSERSKSRYRNFLENNRFADSAATREAYRHETERRLFRELLAHARKRKPDMILFHNANYGGYSVSRSDTLISTEDGKEPGYYAIDAYAHETRGTDLTEPVYNDPLDADLGKPFDPDKLVTNLHLLRMLKGLDQGWKPVLVEFGGRRNGHRMLNQMPPLAFQLSVAECNAALCSYQGYQEGRALTDLFERKPEVMPIVDAAQQVHRFVRRHQQYVVGARPVAAVAVALDDRMQGRDLLRKLARANVQFEVLLDDRVRPETLKQFQRVLVYRAALISDRAVDGLKQFAGDGGRLMVCKPSGERDPWGQPRADNPLVNGGPWEFRGSDCPQEELVRFLTKDVTAPLKIVDCPYVLFTLTRHPDQPELRFVAHLLNYVKRPLENVTVRCPEAKEVKLLSLTPDCGAIERGRRPGEWVIPRLGLYSLLLIR